MHKTVYRIRHAPTYADALEIARGISAKFVIRHSAFGIIETLITMKGCFGCGIAFLTLMLALTLNLFILLIIPIEMLFLLLARRIKLEGGYLKIYVACIPIRKISITDIYWVGTKYSTTSAKRYYYLTRGRRLSFGGVFGSDDRRQESLIFDSLFELGKKKLAQEADNIIEGETPVPVPLSEGATHRLLFWLGLIMLFVFPACALMIIAAMDEFAGAAKNLNVREAVMLLAIIIAPALLGIFGVVWGWVRFFRLYGFRKEVFRTDGFITKNGDFIPYNKMRIILYRGRPDMYAPYPGVIEVQYKDSPVIYIGPERHNFFVLPYVLEIWAPKAFRVRSEESAPLGVASIPYRDTLNLFLPFINEPPRRLMPDWRKTDSIDDIPDSELMLDKEPEAEDE